MKNTVNIIVFSLAIYLTTVTTSCQKERSAGNPPKVDTKKEAPTDNPTKLTIAQREYDDAKAAYEETGRLKEGVSQTKKDQAIRDAQNIVIKLPMELGYLTDVTMEEKAHALRAAMSLVVAPPAVPGISVTKDERDKAIGIAGTLFIVTLPPSDVLRYTQIGKDYEIRKANNLVVGVTNDDIKIIKENAKKRFEAAKKALLNFPVTEIKL